MLTLFPQTSQSSRQEAVFYVFEDNEAVIKMIIKGKESHNETCFQDPKSFAWIGCSIESIWTPRSKSNTLTSKKQLADMSNKGNFTRDEWNHLLCLSNISHFSFTECSEVMPKRTQKELGEERVTAKSRPMMNLIARSSERAPSALSSTAKVKVLWACKLRSIVERRDPFCIRMGKEYSENLRSIKNTGKDLTMKQMFDISEKLSRTIRWDLWSENN